MIKKNKVNFLDVSSTFPKLISSDSLSVGDFLQWLGDKTEFNELSRL